MSFDRAQRYVDTQFTCTNCEKNNEVHLDLFQDIRHKAKNPQMPQGHRESSYYERICIYCHTNNKVTWKENTHQ